MPYYVGRDGKWYGPGGRVQGCIEGTKFAIIWDTFQTVLWVKHFRSIRGARRRVKAILRAIPGIDLDPKDSTSELSSRVLFGRLQECVIYKIKFNEDWKVPVNRCDCEVEADYVFKERPQED